MSIRSLVLGALVVIVLAGCGQDEEVRPVAPSVAPSVAPTVADPGHPAALAADCGGGPATLGVRGVGRTVRVVTRVCVPPPAGGAYWMIVRNSAGNYFPKYALPTTPATTDTITTLGAAVTPGSWRTYGLYRVPAPAITWMREAFAHDASDAGWNGDRSQLPPGCAPVSAEVRYTVSW